MVRISDIQQFSDFPKTFQENLSLVDLKAPEDFVLSSKVHTTENSLYSKVIC